VSVAPNSKRDEDDPEKKVCRIRLRSVDFVVVCYVVDASFVRCSFFFVVGCRRRRFFVCFFV
jgi:hypothetical protein